MLSAGSVVAAGLVWLAVLFGIAVWGERRPPGPARGWALVYSLSLAVHCTSWTFYGTVTQAAGSGWPVPPTFVGAILLYLFGFAFLRRLVRLAREHNATSVADLIATRLGKNSWLAATVTAVAVLGILPYVALQLKAVAMSFGLVTRASELAPPPWQDSALYVALAMAVFAMLFGTRRASAVEHNRGLVLAVAMEAVLKLGAMLAVGVFLLGMPAAPAGAAPVPPPVGDTSGFPALILLGALAMFVLPHQFHVGAVECQDTRHLRTARWLFPLYMLLIALPILPLARVGEAWLAPLGVPSDLYVLALPLSQGQEGLALLAFLGGLSAATGMVILATLTLSVMIGNHWITPLLVRGAWAQRRGDLRGAVLMQRRVAILALVLAAWVYSRATSGSEALADLGATSFSALATLAPAVLFAVFRPQTPPQAVVAGLVASFAVWAWTLLMPDLLDGGAVWPAGLAWLSPDGFLGLGEWSRLGRAVAASLATGFAVTLLLGQRRSGATAQRALPDRHTLEAAADRFLAPRRLREALDGAPEAGPVPRGVAQRVERELAAVLGSASARLLLDAAAREHGRDLDTVAAIVGEASQALRFNQRVLEAALENMTQGISVVDAELRLVAWNARYAERFDYPPALLQVGVPVAELVRHNLARDGLSGAALEAAVARRSAHMRAGTPYVAERRFPDGAVVEIRGNPMPGGGFVATFTDVTAFRRTEAELTEVAATLEQRVAERTEALARASAEAERANQAKSRFLATVSHDLAQPLNAARLFTHALAQQVGGDAGAAGYREAVANIDGALGSAETLLSGLLDVSRLDAGGVAPRIEAVALEPLLAGLASEFGVLAREKGLALRCRVSRQWVRTDAQLLRRVLQNFLANAVRYTARGRILLGVRRRGAEVEIEVWDTGPGIAAADRTLIFEEFRRLDRGGQGLGLGLSIAERMARLLGHPLRLRSEPGRGTVFSVRVPVAAAPATVAPAPVESARAPRGRVLVVDNDPAVLRGMQALLGGWGCEVLAARGPEDACALAATAPPDVLLLDYHLDGGATGLALQQRLFAQTGPRPTVIITADHDEATRAAVGAAGAHLLHKPLKPLALKSLLARFLGRQGAPVPPA
ncbi:PAS-domain containing protein [Coralloluteibacterium thermophilus]|uniref:histidine kinase n=1 Tax=Coralloluteibacterium thermophilum TaxID=2707049 RepID=A0ABV9NG68_9GAMM